jgi:hypothetical protein
MAMMVTLVFEKLPPGKPSQKSMLRHLILAIRFFSSGGRFGENS